MFRSSVTSCGVYVIDFDGTDDPEAEGGVGSGSCSSPAAGNGNSRFISLFDVAKMVSSGASRLEPISQR